jgi:hypothetical protein
VSNDPLLLQKNSTQRVCILWKLRYVPFLKLVMFDGTFAQLKKSFVQIKTQNQNFQWFNLNSIVTPR